jgi:hypothetical protein
MPKVYPPPAPKEKLMDLVMCHECEKVWLGPKIGAEDDPRECTDCGSLLAPVEPEDEHELATSARTGG